MHTTALRRQLDAPPLAKRTGICAAAIVADADALAAIAAGWSGRHEITDRAALMGAHGQAGNARRAEEYAVEIEALQAAERERDGMRPASMPEWAVSEWRIGHAAWANILTHGWRCGRTVWAAEGWSAENVAAEACRLYPMRRFSARDVIAPRGLMVGEAA